MKIDLKKTPDQIELIKAIGSKNQSVSREALEVFAAFIGPVLQSVLQVAGTAPIIYADKEFDEDDNPTFPIDLYADTEDNFIQTWAQSMAGGLPTSQIEGGREMRVNTYRIDTAISWNKKYARKSRMDVISKGIERMAQEILLKQERNAWAVVLKALAEARTRGNKHIITAGTESSFVINDLSRLMTLIRRIHAAWNNGTPTGADSKGLTDLFVSPEIKEQIRAFAFNAMNTVGAGGLTLANDARANGIPLPDNIRERIFNAPGATELYGVSITDLLELGVNRRYNTLFQEFGGSDSAFGFGGNFDTTTDEILVGLDLTREAFLRPVARQADSGGQLTTAVDDQWVARSDKAGLYSFLEEGRICIDSRAVVGIVV